ncbi:glycosyltransferase family 4 protein [Mesorhizobium sp. AR07]|uniref:glycosyltransferase family 4 protein n=1 Tax=Mesorhizobium sp. AR07 TaxID=2865838 RepID=UPI002160A3C1|nr:glycosyltransferase family 4 protein [Mesorhizobium sp. AR07]UVK44400.1 glycosyltransferase family 4 protein [Mesorhizobium sp. AR07]
MTRIYTDWTNSVSKVHKIAIAVFDLAEAGGIERDAARVARALIDRGHDVRLFSTSAGPLAEGIPTTILPARGLTNHSRMATFANDLEVIDRRKQLVVGFQKLTGLDVLYCGDWCFTERPLPFWKRLLPRYRVMRRLEGACYGPRSNTVRLMLSQPQADAYRRAWSIAPERMVVLPPTLDPRRLLASPTECERLELRRSLGVKEGQSAWLWIGLQPKVKGLDRAITALSLVPDALLVVAGVDPMQKWARRMFEEAGRRGCRDRILPVGRVDHSMLDRLFGACDLLVHPARLDVTGTVIVEALAAGLPVITTATCGYAVHVSASGAGIVLPPDASASMIAEAAVASKYKRASFSKLAHGYVGKTELTTGIHHAATRIEEFANRGSALPLETASGR